MHKKIVLAFVGVLLIMVAEGQIKKQFAVENTSACESIKLRVKANSGNCFVKPSQNADILNVFSNLSEQDFAHNFVKTIKGKTCDLLLYLEEQNSRGISQNLSSRVFSVSEAAVSTSANGFWKMYLTDSKPYSLELSYGVGNANIDLSGLAVSKLKISSGSADVNINYISGMENKIEMDTFFVKVDMGSVDVKNVGLAKTRCLLAEVGFGNMLLDFSSKPVVSNFIKGSVGAGNLVIVLPSDGTPIFVKIHDSWLCSTKLPANLKKIGENTFSTANYSKDAKQALHFDLDVSMGNIIFK